MNTEHCDVLIIGGGPGGISAATKVALQGKRAIVINDGPLMGYGIEGAFKSKAGYEIAREYLHVKFRDDVFGQIPAMDFASLHRGIEGAAGEGTATESATADWEEEDRVAELNEELMPDEARSRTS